VEASVVTKRDLEYRHGDVVLRGELHWDETRSETRPGVLVVPEGGGINDHPKSRARRLAELGYVALACDMYGNAEYTTDAKRRTELIQSLRSDPKKLRARALAGLEALSEARFVDRSRMAAIGYCFGGLTVLELARSGANLRGVVSFHGILETKDPAEKGAVRAKVLACHGVEDPFVSPEQVAAFVAEMRAAGVDWQLVTYANAGHGFTRPDSGSMGIQGVFYEARADVRSWAMMKSFLEEVFGAPSA
jgi:dienelactone hydrolase